MEAIMSKCGYRCDLCPAFKANLKSEDDKQRMCDAWAKYIGSETTTDQIEPCAGCLAEGKQGDPSCPVRPCAMEKNLPNCAHCDEFACENLVGRMDFVANAVKNPENIPQDDYDDFIKPFLGREHLEQIRKSLES